MRSLLFFIFILASPLAEAGGRKGGIYGVLGLDRSFTTYKGETARSEFTGYGYDAEVGVDFVSTQENGLNLAAVFHQGDDKNKTDNTSAVEVGESLKYGAKAGFIVSHLALGVGFHKVDFKSRAVSTTNGASTSKISGQENFLFANMTFDIDSKYRAMVEMTYGMGKVGGVDVSTTAISLKMGIVEPNR